MEQEPAAGTLLHQRYRIVKPVASGGMGAVYQAVDTRFDTIVALKGSILTSTAAREAFEDEARLLARLRHPNLPRVTDYFIANNYQQFLVMEFIEGQDLAELLAQHGAPLPISDVLYWAEQVLEALEYLHSQNPPIIHRDIKPSNLKLSTNGEIFLLDFGIAKETDKTVLPGSGTAPYAAPEQLDGVGTTMQSDLYSLAATIYQLATNEPPYTSQARLRELLAQRPDPLPLAHTRNAHVPIEVSRALARGLALDPQQRYATASEMRRYVCLDQGRYRKVRILSQSIVSSVYEAEDTSLGLHVVIKQIRILDDEHAQAVATEVENLTRFAHPVLPRFIDVYRRGKFLCMVTEFIPGSSIYDMIIERGKPFDVDQVIRWTYQLLDVLDHLHSRQPPLFHRNIRPHNLKLTSEGNIVLVDTGIVQADVFAPPEEVANVDFTARSDLYTLAATVYYMVIGESPPLPLKRATAINAGSADPLLPVDTIHPDIPAGLNVMIQKAMALDPDKRPSNAAAMRQMLARITLASDDTEQGATELAPATAVPAPRPTLPQPTRPFWRRRLAVVAVLCVLCVVGVVSILSNQSLAESGRNSVSQVFDPRGSQGGADSSAPPANLPLMSDRSTDTLFSFAVRSVAPSPDNQLLALGGTDGSMEVRQIGADTPVWQCTDASCPGTISSLAFSVDGVFIAVGSVDGVVQLRYAADGSLAFSYDVNAPITSVAFAPDGQTIAVGSADGSVTLWNYLLDSTMALQDPRLDRFVTHADAVRIVAFAPQGNLLASGGQDNLIKLWRSADGTLRETLADHNGWITSLAFAPDGATLVSGSEDRTVKIWQIAEGIAQHTLTEPEQSVTSLAFAPDGRVLAAGSDDTRVYIWRVDDGTLIDTLEHHTDAVTSVAFTQDGRTLLSASNDQSLHTQALNRIILSPETLAAIFLGDITNWNDPQIARDNPAVPLPDLPITVIHRLDSSGTTSIFTHYLTSISPTWRDQIGAGGRVVWPTGLAHDGNSGIAQAVADTPGAIGYVSTAHARQFHLTSALVPNAAGTITTPTFPGLRAAMEQNELPPDLRGMIVNSTDPEAYPIAGFTWLLACQQMDRQPEAAALTDFLYWALTSPRAEAEARALGFVPLAEPVRDQAISLIEQITVDGEPVFSVPDDPTQFTPRRSTVLLTGSGATFPAPIYQSWLEIYRTVIPNAVIRYNPVGSGKGRTDFFNGVVAFAGTDEFASDEELAAQDRCTTLHIPTLVGAVVVVYNLPEDLPTEPT